MAEDDPKWHELVHVAAAEGKLMEMVRRVAALIPPGAKDAPAAIAGELVRLNRLDAHVLLAQRLRATGSSDSAIASAASHLRAQCLGNQLSTLTPDALYDLVDHAHGIIRLARFPRGHEQQLQVCVDALAEIASSHPSCFSRVTSALESIPLFFIEQSLLPSSAFAQLPPNTMQLLVAWLAQRQHPRFLQLLDSSAWFVKDMTLFVASAVISCLVSRSDAPRLRTFVTNFNVGKYIYLTAPENEKVAAMLSTASRVEPAVVNVVLEQAITLAMDSRSVRSVDSATLELASRLICALPVTQSEHVLRGLQQYKHLSALSSSAFIEPEQLEAHAFAAQLSIPTPGAVQEMLQKLMFDQ